MREHDHRQVPGLAPRRQGQDTIEIEAVTGLVSDGGDRSDMIGKDREPFEADRIGFQLLDVDQVIGAAVAIAVGQDDEMAEIRGPVDDSQVGCGKCLVEFVQSGLVLRGEEYRFLPGATPF
jgi:hypothetical protein